MRQLLFDLRDGRSGWHPLGASVFTLWHLEALPLILALEDWTTLESSVVQPSRLFHAALADLYGLRRCVTSGVLPVVPLLFAHPRLCPGGQCDRNTGPSSVLYMTVTSARTGPGTFWSMRIGRRYCREPDRRWPTVGSSRAWLLACKDGSCCIRRRQFRADVAAGADRCHTRGRRRSGGWLWFPGIHSEIVDVLAEHHETDRHGVAPGQRLLR